MYDKDDWRNFNKKRLIVKNQKEIVTLRAIIYGNTTYIHISIGNIIADLLSFKEKDRVKVKFHSKKRNIMLISKETYDEYNGYILRSGKSPNCLKFTISLKTTQDFKLSQTLIANYEIYSEGNLLVDFSKLIWNK